MCSQDSGSRNDNSYWRLLDTGSLDAVSNISLDAALLDLRARELIPDTLRFLSFSRPAALVGFNQSPGRELRLDYCNSHGVDINRRITGGGAVYFDRSQIGWELVASRASLPCGATMADLTAYICNVAAQALGMLGVDAAFRPRNDIEVDGRKICGTGGAYQDGAFLFQGTLLVDFDVEAMIRALRVPTEKLLPRELSSARDRVTCLSEQLGRTPNRGAVIAAFRHAFENALGVELRDGVLSSEEKHAMNQWLQEYDTDEWLWGEDEPGGEARIVRSLYRGEGGTIRAAVSVDNKRNILESVHFTGDYFVDPGRAIYDLESSLRDCRLDEVDEHVETFFSEYRPDCMGLGADDFIAALSGALAKMYLNGRGIDLEQADDLTLVGTSNIMRVLGNARTLLLPYCAKPPDCELRSEDDCDQCDLCSVGDAYTMAIDKDFKVISINNFEHLLAVLASLKREGIQSYIGCCCYSFMVKHLRTFQEAGLSGLLIDIENSTCFELSREQEAYAGSFDEQTELKLDLLYQLLQLCVETDPVLGLRYETGPSGA